MQNDHPEVKFGKTGVLLINLGTPDSTNWWDIRKYLKEFLSDRRVIEVNPVLWQIILNLFILTFRPSKTAHAYKKIWRKESNESPLLYFTRNQAEKLNSKIVSEKIIVDFCRKIGIPVICFPRGIKKNYKDFNNLVKPDGINIDYNIDPKWAKENLENTVIQGGLDPKILLLSEEKIYSSVKKYLDAFKGLPYVFNLGHGMLPDTNPDKVDKLIKFYREY